MSAAPDSGRAKKTSRAIEQAAIDLVLEHGYDRVTVDMICEAAGVSQRTFFNHFKTKDAAVIGSAPRIDERAARRFILSDGPLLAEAIGIIRFAPAGAPLSEGFLLPKRIRAITTNPGLIARQMEQLDEIGEELRDVIELRLRRQHPDASDEEVAAEAGLTTNIVAGVARYVAVSWAEQQQGRIPRPPDMRRITELLDRVLRKLY